MNPINNTKTPKEIKDLWQTPKPLYDRLDHEFGFDCDVAASEENHLCENFITAKMNAFITPWGNSNWCNPPYSREGGGKIAWLKRAQYQSERFYRSTAMLLPAMTGDGWFSYALKNANEVRFIINGRVKFIRADTGESVGGNFFPSVLIIFRGVPNTGQAAISFMDVVR
jgi:phage N-6-adenine-methyltransferase